MFGLFIVLAAFLFRLPFSFIAGNALGGFCMDYNGMKGVLCFVSKEGVLLIFSALVSPSPVKDVFLLFSGKKESLPEETCPSVPDCSTYPDFL